MSNVKHFQLGLVGINILLSILAYRGFFEGKDLLPILIGGVSVLLGLIALWYKRAIAPRYRAVGFALVVLSALALYHMHFNVYLADKMDQSRENAVQVLAGNAAPDLTFEHYFNQTDSLPVAAYIGSNQFTILNFWATWCAPCLKEMPLLDEFYQSNKDRGLGVIGFTDYSGKREAEVLKISKAIEKLGISYPVLVDSSTRVRSAYNADVLPATVLLDREGKVVDYQIGLAGAEKIMRYVDDHLGGEITHR